MADHSAWKGYFAIFSAKVRKESNKVGTFRNLIANELKGSNSVQEVREILNKISISS